ncbi:hypothetical protein U1Q18_043258 [Sarracenia purpurea var. burkii]
MASAVEFEEQRSMFFRELRRYDDYMEIHEGLDLTDCPVFEEEIVALNTTDENDETPVWSEIATLDESTNDVNRITSTLVPSYSEALLLDDHQALIPETQSVRDVSLDDLNNKDSIWSQRRRSRYASAGVLQTQFNESTDSDLVQPFLPEASADNPPTYEEALMFPIVEHPAVSHLRQSEADKNHSPSNQSNVQSPSDIPAISL